MKKEYIQPLIIIVLTALLALTWGRKPKVVYVDVPNDSIVYITKTLVDTVYKPLIDSVVVPKYIKETIVETHVDTVFIVKDYYSEKYYADTLQDDSVAFAYLEEKVFKNEIQNRHFVLDVRGKETTKTYTKIEYKEKAHFYLGVDATTNGNLFLGGEYKTPNRGMYAIGYDPIKKQYMLGIKFKVF